MNLGSLEGRPVFTLEAGKHNYIRIGIRGEVRSKLPDTTHKFREKIVGYAMRLWKKGTSIKRAVSEAIMALNR